jgi:tetratricopeptide (TPR) repeat protein
MRKIRLPPKQSVAVSSLSELVDLSEYLRFAMIEEGKVASDLRLAIARFAELLAEYDPEDDSIAIQEHLAVLYELQGNIPEAMAHWDRAIERTRRLIALGPVAPIDEQYLAVSIQRRAEIYRRSRDASRAAIHESESKVRSKPQKNAE